MKRYVIIVAGGSGTRMQHALPKQFMLLAGKPVLMHTIEAFAASQPVPQIILVINVDHISAWEKLVSEFDFKIPFTWVKGGETRFGSVKNGLKKVPAKSLVAVHDAVRPLVSSQLISTAFQFAEIKGNAVAAIPCKDSLRKKDREGSQRVDREDFFLVQTPQVFHSDLLKKAYNQEYRNEFTDDASVIERLGIPVQLIEGDIHNIKITYPEDLLIAEALLKQKMQV